ncbi:hypothetical protein [uncultured Gammaproteobacteria bacterium]|nr:hypothetical protein [uncultured Gammaproteobacteria bacterium]CAC9963157.1 hypothetical protein [uncultured Gammaproteobacteria bacterium]
MSYEQRYYIYLLKKQGYSQTFIANSMGRSKLTISRELSRNTGNRGYRHKQANNLACERHQQKNKHIKLTAEIKHYISKKLKEYWSPEQIVECLELNEKVKISTETTYRFVLQNKAVGSALYKCLRHQHKNYRKRYGKNNYRGIIPNRVDIDNRPSTSPQNL